MQKNLPIILASIAIVISLFNLLSVETLIKNEIERTVLLTKLNVSELETASRLVVAERSLKDTKSYTAFVETIESIKINLLGVYQTSKVSSSTIDMITKKFDEIIALAKKRSLDTASTTDVLIEKLRTKNN